MGTFGDSWKLTKTAFRLIREDKALLAIPAVAVGAFIGILAMFALGFLTLIFYGPLSGTTLMVTLAILGLVAYFLLWFVSVYFSAALVGAATIKLNGGQPTLGDGLKVARANLGKLLLWALIAGTVGLIIQAIASRFRGLPALLIGFAAEAAWGVATYFIIPTILYENFGAWGSLKHSAGTYFHNFGRTMISNLALTLLVALPVIGAVILGVVGAHFLFIPGYLVLGVVLVIAALAIGIVALLVASAAEGILVAALYRYAKTGKIEEDLVHPNFVGALPSSGPRPLPSSSQ
jgi:MFS family permease